MRKTLSLCFAALAACASPAPGEEDATDGAVLPAPGAPGGAGGPGAALPPGAPEAAPPADECAAQGPQIDLGGEVVTRETCAGEVAELVFRQALCTCGDAQLAGYLATRGFDSRVEAPPDDEAEDAYGGSVGINGSYRASAGYAQVGGSLTIAGAQDMVFAGYLRAGADLRLGGKTTVPGLTRVGRDAWIGADFTGAGPLLVDRDLHRGAAVFSLPLTVGGATIDGPVRVTPPCPCDGDLVDLGAIVAQTARSNDNAALGLRADALAGVVGRRTLALSCGRYYLDEITGVGDIELQISGRVALMVGGSFQATGHFDVVLADDAELDLFVGDNLALLGYHVLGDRRRPAATRVYVNGADDVVLIGASAFVGNLYAPHATVRAPGYLKAYGSIFARDLQVPGYVDISYDRAVADLDCGDDDFDEGDDTEGAPCERCGVCTDGLACVEGECGACTTDADCCQQSVCDGGRCRVI